MKYTIANRASQLLRLCASRYRLPLAGFIALFVLLLLPGAARAGTITVTNTLDNGAGSLRDAITFALPGDTIVFDSSVFSMPLTIALNSQLIVGNSLSIIGPDAALALSGQNTGRVMIASLGVDLTLNNLTIRDGNPGNGAGGGISAGGALSLTHVNLISNTANDYGGAVYASGDLIVNDSYIYSNTAALDGGGLYTRATLQISGSQLISNAAGIRGGALFAGESLSLTQVTIISNTAGTSGGGAATLGNAYLDSSHIYSNAAFLSGGGLYISAALQLTGSQLAGNSSGGPGGGMYAGGALSIVNTDVTSNTANDNGGGAYAIGDVIVNNSTIYSNVAAILGGGLATTATLQINGGVVQGNRAGKFGGGLYAYNALTMSGTQFLANQADQRGGGAYVDGGYAGAILTNGRFVNNTAFYDGGGLDTEGQGGLVMTGTQFVGNTAQGGDMDGGGGAFSYYPAVLNGGLFQGNQTYNGQGGGLFADDLLSITGTQFLNNTAYGQGGGVYAYIDATIVGGLFQANHSTAADGGGLYAGASLSVTGTQFLTNTAGNQGGGFDVVYNAMVQNTLLQGNSAKLGGGLFNETGSVATLTDSTLANNTASISGGGIYLTSTSTLSIVNSTLSANSATSSGGGFYVHATGGLNAMNVTLSGNTAPAGQGGGLYNGGLVTFTNTIVANSTSGGNCAGTVISITDGGYNLDSANACGFSSAKHSLVNALPVLGSLQLNAPGSTPTFRLMPGSQAIDGGTCAGAPTIDQRGAPRPGVTSPFCDIGAYEAQTPVVDLSVNTSVRPLSILAGSAITYTVSFTNGGDAMANGVVITDDMPVGVANLSISNSGAVITQTSNAPLAWNVQNLPGNQPGIITVTGVLSNNLPSGTMITSSVAITTAAPDVNLVNNTALVAATVSTQADLQILMQAAWISTTADVTYTVFYTNAGPSVANNVSITDSLPISLTFQGQVGSIPGMSGPTSTVGALTWFTPTLAPGANGMIVFVEKKNTGIGGWLTSTIAITSTTNDVVGVNNVSQLSVFALGYKAYIPIILKP
ncbi:MAG: DUF11 domain-containing protein [Chloroflexi bacterium]|nr:DUF11 domain-containing protein [Chloroflexota bacterium]MCL5275484.1 DUF11 domain-containing protein [Chloroflexota bacterium]